MARKRTCLRHAHRIVIRRLTAIGVVGMAVVLAGCGQQATAPNTTSGTPMMGGDPGAMMGSMMAGQAPETLSWSDAVRLGDEVPPGASIDRGANRVIFRGQDVRATVLAGPAGHSNMIFRIAGLSNPTVVLPRGAHVSLHFLNGDRDTSHGLLVTPSQPPFPYMAMMSVPTAFTGAVAAPTGDATDRGVPGERIAFDVTNAGDFTYICPVPGHATLGMHGRLRVA